MLGRCKDGIWHADDFSHCFQHDYLQTLIPLGGTAVSLVWLGWEIGNRWQLSRGWKRGYKSLDEEEDNAVIEDAREHGKNWGPLTEEDSVTVEWSKPRAGLTIALLEVACALAVLSIQTFALIWNVWGRKSTIAIGTSIAVWAYIALLTIFRLISKPRLPNLWYHTTFLYGLLWPCTVLVFRSQLIHQRNKLASRIEIGTFVLNTLLLLIALTCRKGNRVIAVEHEGSIEPPREPRASILSLATFSWMDSLIWKGYRKTSEMKDVWNLDARDKAAAILADYRQLKRTSSLAFHLLWYFKSGLLFQGAWAAVAGVTTFMPTLLLQAILQYIEDPSSTPRNAAWFYVVLLFITGAVSAVASGQALWRGRKICIRLTAIIIGEIYAKALRRRVAATNTEKVLGDEAKKEQSKGNAFSRFFASLCGSKNDNPEASKPTEDESQVSSGAIINLMAVDSFEVAEVSAYLHFLWAEAPVQFIMSIALLYRVLGTSSIVGIGMMILLLPVNLVISRRFSAIQVQILAATDARIHATNEVLTNIRIIKYFAWEQRFLGKVDEKRAAELRALRNRYLTWAIAATTWSGAPIVITLLTFAVYTLVEKKPLVPSIAFTALSLFNLLRIPLDQLADMVAHVQESKVSVNRVEEYLNDPETDKYKQLAKEERDENGEVVIGFTRATFTWNSQDAESFRMMNLDLRFKNNGMNVVVGPTGSGKTSLLMALLGEMSLLSGSVHLPCGKDRRSLKADPNTGFTESVAYCAQQPWLVNGTIKDNIVFESDWDTRRYKQVIVACSLQRDLEVLEAGDSTQVGERGVTLSGGQKQRISLARALYSNARHMLLDDVLSAVDSHTAKWIFDHALRGPLMRNRTCILVTHNVTLCLPYSEYAVVLDNGRVTAQGIPTEVIDSGVLAEDSSKFDIGDPSSKAPSTIPSRVPSMIGVNALDCVEEASHSHVPSSNAIGATIGDPLTSVMSMDMVGLNVAADVFANDEKKAEGAVGLHIIWMYLKRMGGPVFWATAASCFAAQQVLQVATNVWIREWANAYTSLDSTASMNVMDSSSLACLRGRSCMLNMPKNGLIRATMYSHQVNVGYYLGVYAAIGAASMIITFLHEGILFYGSLSASTRIHRRLMERITHAKFRFFDSTPLGQIMNRFSKDIEALDQEVAPVATGVVHCLASIITIIVLISIITPGFLIAAVFITILYFVIGRLYINSSRDLKRLESVQRSPLYQQFGETLTGMTTIRAYGDEQRFIRKNLEQINTHSRPFIYLWGTNRWLAFRVDIVGALVSFFTGVFIIARTGAVDAGAAGLAMTYAVTFTENVLWFVRLYATNEQNMNSVERIKEYLDVEQEAPPFIEDYRPPAEWPSRGEVEFVGYSTKYRDNLEFVLKNISVKFQAGEKVGVVGRTGAGKSSLALAMFRALEAVEGKIVVDDIDIGLIGLNDLRSNIVMVPQDPTLFTGTIRSNLDPFGLFSDEEIFAALKKVHLIGSPSLTISANPSRPTTPVDRTASGTAPASNAAKDITSDNKNIFLNLSSPVAESGSNLSQGQRQLLCLARALLKSPKVLLMDEATASIDYATDFKIQETIREIRNTTVTIAHRLQTIIDYDKVLVLDQGEIAEFGDPFDLISKKEGTFRAMCETSGDLELLLQEAKKAHVLKSAKRT
ncbi:hypothetical protein K470DRAFT_260069 [Piedraia hortae CBS 480.64]|uniref:ATP-dependent bile acid permease n=1 Tax=Piedraia hortae CBS 480.64 TaxID=1314780 RepID=A0A6A7BT86_9PEZI|nr:hypothetical protein K470DRAFT_260069 [Piedraia hortae CBS 480.64]